MHSSEVKTLVDLQTLQQALTNVFRTTTLLELASVKVHMRANRRNLIIAALVNIFGRVGSFSLA